LYKIKSVVEKYIISKHIQFRPCGEIIKQLWSSIICCAI